MKRPSFQFYPADWRKDTALQFCSLAARGLWVEMMCIAHECDPYGYLRVNGKPMTTAQIARLAGIGERECNKLLQELFEAGVPSTGGDGAIYSRRMVRDETVREKRAAGGNKGAEFGSKGASFGSKGGRPAKQKPPEETPLDTNVRGVSDHTIKPPIKPPPSSSSSSSSSSSEHLIAHGVVNSAGCTAAGLVCARLRQEARMADMNPSHPKLIAMLDSGFTSDEIVSAGTEAVSKGKGFLYALAIAEGRRRDAAAIVPLPSARASPHMSHADKSKLAAARAIFGTEIEGNQNEQSSRIIDVTPTFAPLLGG